MIISYDAYLMQELVRACQTANDELQKAQNLIQEVRSHNDWTCKEKDTIDDLMSSCRTMVKRLCEEEFSFLEAIKLVEGELSDAEKNVSRLFEGVETILGKVLAIPVAQTVVSGTGLLTGGVIGEAVDGIKDFIADNGAAEAVGKVKDFISDVFEETEHSTENLQFDANGYLVWPENGAPPSIELIESLGGFATMTMNGDVSAYWPDGVTQNFPSEFTQNMFDKLTDKTDSGLMDVINHITETIKVVSVPKLDF